MSKGSKKKKKKQRRIDPTFKQVITNRFAELDIKVETEVQVSYLWLAQWTHLFV